MTCFPAVPGRLPTTRNAQTTRLRGPAVRDTDQSPPPLAALVPHVPNRLPALVLNGCSPPPPSPPPSSTVTDHTVVRYTARTGTSSTNSTPGSTTVVQTLVHTRPTATTPSLRTTRHRQHDGSNCRQIDPHHRPPAGLLDRHVQREAFQSLAILTLVAPSSRRRRRPGADRGKQVAVRRGARHRPSSPK